MHFVTGFLIPYILWCKGRIYRSFFISEVPFGGIHDSGWQVAVIKFYSAIIFESYSYGYEIQSIIVRFSDDRKNKETRCRFNTGTLHP